MIAAAPICRRGIVVTGVVQGVGFRPFVHNAAKAESLCGWVLNESGSVCIEVQGDEAAVDRFVARLRNGAPRQSRVRAIDVTELPPAFSGAEDFLILDSVAGSAAGSVLPADLKVCEACIADIRDPDNRRHGYAFTNCTDCGPRWSIVQRLPYDRANTSMKSFDLCDECHREYRDPADRRFHAQPVACPHCGPILSLANADGRTTAADEDALDAAADVVLGGGILALKGIGGFQLLCDATSELAVRRLRRRKRRPDKPLALMMATAEEVRRHCRMDDDERAVWESPAGPIVLLRGPSETITSSVAPRSTRLGVMAPTSPLHVLLLDRIGRPVVCTSGNLADEPMAIGANEALEKLSGVADRFLTHNRPIVRPVDDSVVRVDRKEVRQLRRARGYAPAPITLLLDVDGVVAVGPRLKNTVAVGVGHDVILSPHLGDLDHADSVRLHRRTILDLVRFFDVQPRLVVCDAHPDYESTLHAERLASEWNVGLLRVQHHHAHVAACIAEHGLEGPVLGFAWDGAGYGDDGDVWGGEALLCEAGAYRRIATLRSFPLLGGERAARDPRLAALGLLAEIDRELAAEFARKCGVAEPDLDAMLSAPNLVRTTSIGRLFDGVAALVGVHQVATFEGQSAMALEWLAQAAEPSGNTPRYVTPLSEPPPFTVDWRPLVGQVLRDVANQVSAKTIAAAFHAALARLVTSTAKRVGCPQVALTGGCFQNEVLASLAREKLVEAGFTVYENRVVPPGDGGVALGQAYLAALRLGDDTPCA